MDSNNETVYATMQHKLKRSKYIFGRYSVIDLLVLIANTAIFVFLLNTDINIIRDPVLKVFVMLVLIVIFGTIIIITSANKDFYHNGIGLFLCMFDYYRHKVTLKWGGVCFDEGQEDESNERSREKSRKVYERRN